MIQTGSVIVGLVGILGTGAALFYRQGKASEWKPQHYWFLGLAGLFPAWLVAFLALLEPVAQQAAETPLPPKALLSSGAGLLGIIATDYLLRRLQKSGSALPSVTYWVLGVVALLPAWLIVSVSFK